MKDKNIDELFKEAAQRVMASYELESAAKIKEYETKVLNSPRYKQVQKYISDISHDFLASMKIIRFYSSRASSFYANSMTVFIIDDIAESIVGIMLLVENGIINSTKREMRFILELCVKLTIIDLNLMQGTFEEKTAFLHNNVPNSSIEYVDEISLPFTEEANKKLVNEIKDIYYKHCRYIHPSKHQINERQKLSKKGYSSGFEGPEVIEKLGKVYFRLLDIILILLLNGFGQSMSGDIFNNCLDMNTKWKFHKGKYTRMYRKLFDYKLKEEIDCQDI